VKCEIKKCEKEKEKVKRMIIRKSQMWKNENKKNGKKIVLKTKLLFGNWPKHYIGQFSIGFCKNQPLCILVGIYI